MNLKVFAATLLSQSQFAMAQEGPATLQMPRWLQMKTGLTTWPSAQPPYIYESFHDQSKLRCATIRNYGECPYASDEPSSDCSYDCHTCIAPKDVYTCKQLSQSFDDGPSQYTPKLLDEFKRTKTKTTFFVIGQNVVRYPTVAKRETKEGHLVAVHTWSHRFLPGLSNEEVYAELQWCIWAIKAASGVTPKYFRPPYGGLDNRVRDIASQLGLRVVLWNYDTSDWKLATGDIEASSILKNLGEVLKNSVKKTRFGRSVKTGLLLEHDITESGVNLGLKVHKLIGSQQKSVCNC